MMKRIFAILLTALMLFALAPLAAAEETPRDGYYLEINEQTFPDDEFRLFIRYNYAKVEENEDCDDEARVWYMTQEDVLAVKEMEIDCDVTDFTGLEHFTELTMLTVDTNTTAVNLNFSANTKLRHLALRNFNVNAIDLSPLQELTYLNVESVPLRSLDLSQNTKLMDLSLENVPLTALDVSRCADLHTLFLTEVPISALDVTNCKLLKGLYIMGGSVAALDVTNCAYLRNLALFNLPITALDLTNCTKLESLQLQDCPIAVLDLSNCEKLIKAIYEGERDDATPVLRSLNLGNKPALVDLFFNSTNLTEIDLSQCPNLERIEVIGGQLSELDLSQCPKMGGVHCDNNQLTSLILHPSCPLFGVWCGGNHFAELDLSAYTALYYCETGSQTVTAVGGFTPSGDAYAFDMRALVGDPSRVSFPDDIFSYNSATGIVTASEAVDAFTYLYDTGMSQMPVNVTFAPAYSGEAVAAFADDAVQYKGETPYVVANGSAQKPNIVVTDESGNEVDPAYYTVTYADNVNPGTGTATVAFNGTDRTLSLWFKIYLPATVMTTVENTENGVRVRWEPVPGAKGYVIYRRAWNQQSDGWTKFARWNNTTAVAWTDTTVYAGTRYQYGVKAYFDDPTDNFNLGIVGPLKTTVRITTRKLLGVDAGEKQMTVRWSGSKYCTGYQIKYSTDPDFKKDVIAYKVTRPDAYRNTVKNLASGTTYYVTVRSYTVFGGMTYFGEWSNVLSTKVG